MDGHVIRGRTDRITVKVVVYEDYLLDTVEPCPSILVVRHIGRHTCSYNALDY